MKIEPQDHFAARHIGPRPHDAEEMLRVIGVSSMDQLIDETVPSKIRLRKPLDWPEAEGEQEYLSHLRRVASKNKVFRSYIGLGYFNCFTPSVIRRTVLENPSWYTPYTPYQAEIAQGRLEAMLNFQTMVKDLTAMDVANASLLDEATAAGEAMAMLHRIHNKSDKKSDANVFLVSDKCYPQTIDVLRTRADALGIELKIGHFRTMGVDRTVFGALVQYPDADGNISDFASFIQSLHSAGAYVAVATDLLSLTLLKPPGDLGADVVVGNSQRFGVPLGFGGPHAAFFATRDEFVRQTPGRIIGVSVDAQGNRALRMALQTREQHIRRERARSNICTSQALLASIAGFYAVYHGPDGLKRIGSKIYALARILESKLKNLGLAQENPYFFDTLKIRLPDPSGIMMGAIRDGAEKARMNFRYLDDQHLAISLDETTQQDDIKDIVNVFCVVLGAKFDDFDLAAEVAKIELNYHVTIVRKSVYLPHPVFNTHNSETQMMRYIKDLERRDLGLDTSMIPLGSCTMKLNAASEMLPITWPEFGEIHPFAGESQTRGYRQIFEFLERALCKITGLAGVSLQPNSGAQGELAGLLVIRAFHRDKSEAQRNIVLIPASAHGTNPASAVMAGMEVVVVACDQMGSIDIEDLKAKADQHSGKLAALMVTYPSTYGVFEEHIQEICAIVHRFGGQVYMDGANMNAQVGLTSPARIGADVCHLNLHKTFSIPHGGGGPGMGPICVAKHLLPYLPGHPVVSVGGEKGIHAVAAAPWGSASILLISYGYIRMLGGLGMTEATRHAILNANYIKARLEKHYDVHYVGAKDRVAHEMIFDLRPLKEKSGIDEQDVAKRLMDYGFHAPTVSWPVPGTMMIEPTESEAKDELDRFCDAMISIRGEIQAVMNGEVDRENNVLKNAPHTTAAVSGDTWPHPYSREQAAFPLPFVRANKFWPSVGRIDNTYGDKNLVCSCPTTESYAEEAAAVTADKD